MKLKRGIWIAALLAGVALSSCGKKDESKDAPAAGDAGRLQESAKKICEKITECASEQLKALPPAQRKMAETMLNSSKEACLGQYGAGAVGGETVTYTKEEMDMAMKCMDAVSRTACKDLMSEAGAPDSCKQFEALLAKRGKK